MAEKTFRYGQRENKEITAYKQGNAAMDCLCTFPDTFDSCFLLLVYSLETECSELTQELERASRERDALKERVKQVYVPA